MPEEKEAEIEVRVVKCPECGKETKFSVKSTRCSHCDFNLRLHFDLDRSLKVREKAKGNTETKGKPAGGFHPLSGDFD